MSFETVAGSTIAVSVSTPATFDAAGYGALAYTNIGEITDLGSGLGRSYNTATHSPVASRQQIEKKASYKLGTLDLMAAWDGNDAGQALIAANAGTDTVLSFKIVKQSGAIRYFQAQVSELDENFGTVDNVNTAKITLLLQKDVVRTPN
jgi:hypothetical protein